MLLTATTLSKKQKDDYGHETVPLMETNLPGDLLVCEDESIVLRHDGGCAVCSADVFDRAPEFVNRHKKTLNNKFRHNAAKFAWKVYAMYEGLSKTKQYDYDYFLWLDADVYVHKPFTEADFEALIGNSDLAWLDRPHFTHAETGFLLFDMNTMWTEYVLRAMLSLYDDETLFMFKEWHDAYPFTFLVRTYQHLGIKAVNLNEAASGAEAFKHSPLAGKMSHIK